MQKKIPRKSGGKISLLLLFNFLFKKFLKNILDLLKLEFGERQSLCNLTDAEVVRLRSKLAAIINKEDCLFLDVDDERYQKRNREIALSRLENRILQALVI